MNTEKVTITPKQLKGQLTIPASKSYMQRACAAALLKGGKTTLTNFGISNDDKAALNTIEQLGAKVNYVENTIVIESDFPTIENIEINTGESGLGVRMFTPIVALVKDKMNVNGHGSLLKRPMNFFDHILPALAVEFTSNNGFLPFTIKGPLQNKDITVDGSLSSQFLTGLLFAFAYNNKSATITVNSLTSKPYIDITLEVLKDFGFNVPTHTNYEAFVFNGAAHRTTEDFNYKIESDWSSASFFLVGAAINGPLVIKGLNMFSVQADKAILTALQAANVSMSVEAEQIEIRKSTMQPFHFDATECPDLFPPLVAMAANINGISTISGATRLTHKESNRALTLQEEFSKLGVAIKLQDDLMIIEGTGNVVVDSSIIYSAHNDHRIAMALAVAVQNQEDAITIVGADSVNKSYPDFWQHLSQVQNA